MSEGFEDIEFSREEIRNPTKAGQIGKARWDRIREQVDVREVISMLYPDHKITSNKLCCPFHGSDRTPSFTIYPASNSAYCFGCPDGDGMWDSIKIVARTLEISKKKAVRWLENEFNLPPLEEEEGTPSEDESEPEERVTLTVEDLAPSYIKVVRDYVLSNRREVEDTTSEAQEAIETFFRCRKEDDPLPLARMVGLQKIRELRKSKVEAETLLD